MMKRIVSFIFILSLTSAGCSKDNKSVDKLKAKPISQIQEEIGIPVRVTPVKLTRLEKWQTYTGDVEGAEQVTVFGALGDIIDKVHVKTGEQVNKDQVVASYETDNPTARYRQAQIALTDSEKFYQRMKAVYDADGISQQKMDNLESQYKLAQENFKATAKLINVKSPIAGVVVDVFVEDGEPLKPGGEICKVARISRLKTTVSVDENDVYHFKKGQDVHITWSAVPQEMFTGKIQKISLSVDPKLRSFTVEIMIENEKGRLRPGAFVNVAIRTLNKHDVITVARHVVTRNEDKASVFVVENKKAIKKEIKLGQESGNIVEVTAGLIPGDLLVVEGHTLLRDQNKVNIVK
ncbi:efflux RND transporter periplasmic adaptor subunit [candidate division CSSED10-310 bacterium]|uniref:Efflux RND transporter periplasmic adaptor subunit n=1 Tax=candidate division CSSED10-310 bacterium TaxID=2855610 RepID=A0ABV6Z1Y9_UNCC1